MTATTATLSTGTLDRLVERLEQDERLDRISERLRPLVQRAIGQGARRDALTGRWLGHPAHPALVVVPLGCWTAATVLDAVGGRSARRAARRLVGLGVLGVGPAAATGAADWLDTSDAEQRVGVAHMAANTAGVTLFALSWWLRRRHHLLGVLTAMAGSVATGAAGFLGGHLAYRRGVGVNTTAFRAGPTEWTELDVGALVIGQPTAAHAGAVGLVAVLDDDGHTVRVLEDRCTHRGGPLHEGRVAGRCVECPWHQSRFDLRTGAVVQGPATAPQPAYEVDGVAGGPLRVQRTEQGSLRRNSVA